MAIRGHNVQQDNQPTYKTNPRIASHGEWIGGEFYPDTPFSKISKDEIISKRQAEWRAMHKERARLAVRMKVGKDWDGKADNDNLNWPLATSLIREGNTELLKAAVAYRKIHEQAHSGAVLGGHGVAMKDGFSLDRFSSLKPDGAVVYNRPRQRKGADVDIPARQYTVPPKSEDIDTYSNQPNASAGSSTTKNWTNVPKPWNGDRPVNDMIDAQGKLAGLRSRIGVLVEPLEMAVVDGSTYQAVGNAQGVADRSGSIAAGRAIVHMALLAVRDALGRIKRSDLAA